MLLFRHGKWAMVGDSLPKARSERGPHPCEQQFFSSMGQAEPEQCALAAGRFVEIQEICEQSLWSFSRIVKKPAVAVPAETGLV